MSLTFRGKDCKITDGYVVSGRGTVLANAALHQDRVYWEVTVEKLPKGADFVLGVARKYVNSIQFSAVQCRRATMSGMCGNVINASKATLHIILHLAAILVPHCRCKPPASAKNNEPSAFYEAPLGTHKEMSWGLGM